MPTAIWTHWRPGGQLVMPIFSSVYPQWPDLDQLHEQLWATLSVFIRFHSKHRIFPAFTAEDWAIAWYKSRPNTETISSIHEELLAASDGTYRLGKQVAASPTHLIEDLMSDVDTEVLLSYVKLRGITDFSKDVPLYPADETDPRMTELVLLILKSLRRSGRRLKLDVKEFDELQRGLERQFSRMVIWRSRFGKPNPQMASPVRGVHRGGRTPTRLQLIEFAKTQRSKVSEISNAQIVRLWNELNPDDRTNTEKLRKAEAYWFARSQRPGVS